MDKALYYDNNDEYNIEHNALMLHAKQTERIYVHQVSEFGAPKVITDLKYTKNDRIILRSTMFMLWPLTWFPSLLCVCLVHEFWWWWWQIILSSASTWLARLRGYRRWLLPTINGHWLHAGCHLNIVNKVINMQKICNSYNISLRYTDCFSRGGSSATKLGTSIYSILWWNNIVQKYNICRQIY